MSEGNMHGFLPLSPVEGQQYKLYEDGKQFSYHRSEQIGFPMGVATVALAVCIFY
jgi:hypothetical protein